jgi:hypothetical protein
MSHRTRDTKRFIAEKGVEVKQLSAALNKLLTRNPTKHKDGSLVSYKLTDVSEVYAASIITAIVLMMEVVNTSETSVNFNETTRRGVPERRLPSSQSPP